MSFSLQLLQGKKKFNSMFSRKKSITNVLKTSTYRIAFISSYRYNVLNIDTHGNKPNTFSLNQAKSFSYGVVHKIT